MMVFGRALVVTLLCPVACPMCRTSGVSSGCTTLLGSCTPESEACRHIAAVPECSDIVTSLALPPLLHLMAMGISQVGGPYMFLIPQWLQRLHYSSPSHPAIPRDTQQAIADTAVHHKTRQKISAA